MDGARVGLDWGMQLKAGQDVTLPDGHVVLAKDLMPETTPGRVCMCIPDVTLEHVDALVDVPAWQK